MVKLVFHDLKHPGIEIDFTSGSFLLAGLIQSWLSLSELYLCLLVTFWKTIS